jgi:hypothetical protein
VNGQLRATSYEPGRPLFGNPPAMPRNNLAKQPSLSGGPAHKLIAALNWSIGRNRKSDAYRKAPRYFDDCLAWYERLTEDQQDYLTYVVGDEYAERWAAKLPPAPRCSL